MNKQILQITLISFALLCIGLLFAVKAYYFPHIPDNFEGFIQQPIKKLYAEMPNTRYEPHIQFCDFSHRQIQVQWIVRENDTLTAYSKKGLAMKESILSHIDTLSLPIASIVHKKNGIIRTLSKEFMDELRLGYFEYEKEIQRLINTYQYREEHLPNEKWDTFIGKPIDSLLAVIPYRLSSYDIHYPQGCLRFRPPNMYPDYILLYYNDNFVFKVVLNYKEPNRNLPNRCELWDSIRKMKIKYVNVYVQ